MMRGKKLQLVDIETEAQKHGATEAVRATTNDVENAAAEGVGARADIAVMERERVMLPDLGGRRYPERARAALGNFCETTNERVWITPRTKKRMGRRGSAKWRQIF
jgi:hypothetical protein